jgi:hypothetical protein
LNLSGASFAPQGTGLDAVVTAALRFQAENSSGPVLESLIVEDCPQLTSSPFRNAWQTAINTKKPVLASLRVLSLARSGEVCANFHFSLPRFQYAAPNLEILDLDSVAYPSCGLNPSISTKGMPNSIDWPSHWAIQPSLNLLRDLATSMPGWRRLKVCRFGAKALRETDHTCLSIVMLGSSRPWVNVSTAVVAHACAASTSLEEICASNSPTFAWNELLRLLNPTRPPLRVLHFSRSGGLHGRDVHMRDLANALTESSWVCDTLEEIDVSDNRSVADKDAEALAACYRLRKINFSGTGVTEKGLLTILREAQLRGALEAMEIKVEGCRSMPRSVRQAGALGPLALAKSVGIL